MISRWPGQNRLSPGAPNGFYRHGHKRLIELRYVVKTYESVAEKLTLLRDINLQIDAGEFVAIVGKSGSGKTTLTNVITGIDRPTAGEIVVADTLDGRIVGGTHPTR